MGGYSSRRRKGGATADISSRIDLGWMLRGGYAAEGQNLGGTLRWTRGGKEVASICYEALMGEPGEERLLLSYWRGSDDAREHVEQAVSLCFTVPQYGGKRWWMICPISNVRVAKLYYPPGGDRFASRQVWRLGYQIQRVAKKERACERMFSYQKKLGGRQGLGFFPERPKGMWCRTYERHMASYLPLERAAELAFPLGLVDIRKHAKKYNIKKKKNS